MKTVPAILTPRAMARAIGSRRGTVLLLALGVLGILSIAAISYVTIVRVDRSSAEAGARRTIYQRQPDAVIDHIGAIIGADLWGNKVVTERVPTEAWPTMFEDGDTRDIPATDLVHDTFNRRDPGENPSDESILPFDNTMPNRNRWKVGYPDDAWLASTEPLWEPATGEPRDTKRWPQITNLRGAYTWDASSQNITQQRWVRGNGRFVDLGQWFLKATQPSPGQWIPNPSVEMMKWNGGDAVTSEGRLGADMGVDQDVFQYQVNTMARRVDPRDDAQPSRNEIDPLTPRDERQWVDTDGDLRPDARWQQIDALGSLGGLSWFVAARIIDASALVNVNSSIEFGSPSDRNPLASLADGRTPADVDLYRLLVGAAFDRVYGQRVVSQGVSESFAQALNTRTDILGVFSDAARFNPDRFGMVDDNIDGPSGKWRADDQRFTREQREAYWRYFGASPQMPAARRGSPIPIRDLVDLNAFWASNHVGLLSEAELRFDGPAVNGYLPGRTGTPDLGPMRSRESPPEIRAFAPGSNPAPEKQIPTADQIRKSLRRLLTPVSGDAPFSPVPVLNTGPSFPGATSPFQGLSWREKIPLDRPLDGDGVRRAFEAFVWALAPLATNLPLNRDLDDNNLSGQNAQTGDGLTNAADLHYGGGVGGPAGALGRFERFSPKPSSPSPLANDASFAAVTAASLAVNLKDALDADSVPSVARFFGKPNTTQERDLIVAGPRNPIILDSSFAQGDIEETNLSAIGAQQPGSFQDAGGMTIVGLERQPFLSEMMTFVIYSDYAGDASGDFSPGGNTNNHLIGDNPQEVMGSGIVVELVNPWSTPITLDGGTQGGYSIVIPESINDMGSNPFVLSLPNSFVIPPGERPRFYWLLKKDSGRWGEVRDKIVEDSIFMGAVELDDTAVSPAPDSTTLRVPFRDMLNGSLPALLVYDRRQLEIPLFPGYVIDRMAPDEGGMFPVGVNPGGFDLMTDKADNVPGGAPSFSFVGYFQTLGYVDDAMNTASNAVNAGLMTGRLLVSSSLSRTHAQSSAPAPAARGGFPAYVLEVPNANHVHVRRDAHAWLEPTVLPEPLLISRSTPADIIRDAPDFSPNFPADHTDIGSVTKRADFGGVNTGAIDPTKFQGFQLYVPDPATPGGPRLNALSELHMLSCYANTCRTRTPTSPRSWDLELADLSNWQTVGEKMGLSIRRDFDMVESWYNHAPGDQFPFDQADANSYIGTLDPTRFILNDPMGDMAAMSGLPDTMAIPLALRVFDCFWPMSTPSFLAQGKININTAPREVLEAMPLVSPAFPFSVGTTSMTAGVLERIEDMLRYRDAEQQEGFITSTIRIDGLRRRASGASPRPAGFVSTGELAILDRWEPSTPGVVVSGAPSWLHLADPVNAIGDDGPPWEMVKDYADPSYNPINDVEERLALYRAVSNIVTTRSDVFLAWFVVRGYEPTTIAQIPIKGASDNDRLEAMDDTSVPLRPAYESRWLVVFDRSNVRRPTDRPEVLLKVELPRAEP